MLLNCPSCQTKYLVPIGQLAGAGRVVRCARCRYQWHARLPTTIDVFQPAQPDITYHSHSAAMPPQEQNAQNDDDTPTAPASYQLPAVIRAWSWRHIVEKAKPLLIILLVILLLLPVLILARQAMVNKFPFLKSLYENMGMHIDHSGDGLAFDKVKSELKYDGGTMRLTVDGVVRNNTVDIQLIPDIKARALGPDQHIIQSWWVPAPAATVPPGGEVPFHTEVNAPMQRTIADVYLEFYAQDEQGDVAH